MMSAAKVLRYRNVEVPRQIGEVGRLRVLKGQNEGMLYVVKNSSVVIGRGDESDVMIGDLKASRKHAKLEYSAQGWAVNDLGSSNGIFYQGEYVRKFPIHSGEHFSVGDTVFEFIESSEGTQILMAPLRPAADVIQMDKAIAAQRLKVQQYAKPTKFAASKKKANPLLILAVLGAGIYSFQDDLISTFGPMFGYSAPQVVRKAAPKKDESSNLAALLPTSIVNTEVGKTAEQYYRQGFREYREGNYLRAKAQYELALQVNPAHKLARKGIMTSAYAIDEEVKRMMGGAEKAMVVGRLREAKGYYESTMRLLYFDRSNPDYIECEEQLKQINAELAKGYESK